MNIDTLKGIGPKTSKIFQNNGIITINDLMSYYPFRYDVIKRSNINQLVQDDKIIIDGIVDSNPSLFFFNNSSSYLGSLFISSFLLCSASLIARCLFKSYSLCKSLDMYEFIIPPTYYRKIDSNLLLYLVRNSYVLTFYFEPLFVFHLLSFVLLQFLLLL